MYVTWIFKFCYMTGKKLYIYRGKVKITPEPLIKSMEKGKCLFHNADSWPAILVHVAMSIITCPFNFDYFNNQEWI